MRVKRAEITADFAGANSPVGSRVRFSSGGTERAGTVARLRLRGAEVVCDDGRRCAVPYAALAVVPGTVAPQITLVEVDDLARRLIAEQQDDGSLGKGWRFGFDLAPARAGVCHYSPKRICLSVTFCQRAAPSEVEDTILHEIAHAIVGPRHNHDAVWKAAAQRIGCTGDRCHRVEHTAARWVGECGCGGRWFRHRLQRRMRHNRICAKCRAGIVWRENTGAIGGM